MWSGSGLPQEDDVLKLRDNPSCHGSGDFKQSLNDLEIPSVFLKNKWWSEPSQLLDRSVSTVLDWEREVQPSFPSLLEPVSFKRKELWKLFLLIGTAVTVIFVSSDVRDHNVVRTIRQPSSAWLALFAPLPLELFHPFYIKCSSCLLFQTVSKNSFVFVFFNPWQSLSVMSWLYSTIQGDRICHSLLSAWVNKACCRLRKGLQCLSFAHASPGSKHVLILKTLKSHAFWWQSLSKGSLVALHQRHLLCLGL